MGNRIREVKKKSKKCPECGGSGFLGGDIWSKLPCATCNGSGKVPWRVREMK